MNEPRVELGMYPFSSTHWAWRTLWSAVAARAPWAPAELAAWGDVHAGWGDDRCIITQICGGPLVSHHLDDFEVIGAFAIDVPGATDHARYRSVLLSPDDVTVAAITAATTRAAVNSPDSLSGWVSLVASTVGPGNPWTGEVTITGSHRASVDALAAGDADLASIDAWSLALISHEEPEAVRGLHPIGVGPEVPTPPIVARHGLGRVRIAELGDAIDAATSDPEIADALAALRIRRFVRLRLDDYLPILALQPGT